MLISSFQSKVGSFKDLKKKRANTKIDFKVLLMLLQHHIGNESLTVQLGNISSASQARELLRKCGILPEQGASRNCKITVLVTLCCLRPAGEKEAGNGVCTAM